MSDEALDIAQAALDAWESRAEEAEARAEAAESRVVALTCDLQRALHLAEIGWDAAQTLRAEVAALRGQKWNANL